MQTLSNKKGATLIEALVAIVILAVGIAGSSALIVQTMRLSDLANEQGVATLIARNRFERMSTSDFNDLKSWEVSDMVCDATGNRVHDGSYRINTVVTHPMTNLTEIAVEVYIRNHKTLEFDKPPRIIVTRRASY